jgi:hypothetical protein
MVTSTREQVSGMGSCTARQKGTIFKVEETTLFGRWQMLVPMYHITWHYIQEANNPDTTVRNSQSVSHTLAV